MSSAAQNAQVLKRNQAESATPLHGRALLAARIVWVTFFGLTIGVLLISLPAFYQLIRQPGPDNPVVTAGSAQTLIRAGISLDTYAGVAVAMACAISLIAAVMSLILFVRRGNTWITLLVSLFIVIYPEGSLGVVSAFPSDVGLEQILNFLYTLPVTSLYYGIFLLFPSGRFVPRRSWMLLVAWSVWRTWYSAADPNVLGGWLTLGYPLFYGAAIACIVYRYRRASTPIQRQQTKWVIAALVASLLANQAFWLPSTSSPLADTLYPPTVYIAYQLAVLLTPIAFFIAIQRYRLYDIDALINRTLVYGSLTAILAAVYLASIVGLQQVTHAFNPQTQDNPLLIVVSTLLIAALFTPLRRRLQRTIDRRFYRAKYDAARTLAAFGAVLRQDVDLAELREHLLGVVEETMQPAHVSLWLKSVGTER